MDEYNASPQLPSESREELLRALKEIAAWEKDQKDLWFWEKLGRLPFQLLDRLTPRIIQDKVGQALDEVGSYVQTGGQYLISEKGVLELLDELYRAEKPSNTIQAELPPLTLLDVSALPLRVMDQAAGVLLQSRSTWATLQGATTGFGGIFTLAVDIPASLGLSLKVIQELALIYGYNPREKRERIFTIKCLQFASSDIVGKKAILQELADFDNESRQREVISQLQGWREVVNTYRDNFGWKKLFQLVPIAGMVFGAIINRSALQDVAEAARMLYRKRQVTERLRTMESDPSDPIQ